MKTYSIWSEADRVELARFLCSGFFGFHTDGILFLRPEMNFDFAWDFYNSDGSHAEMCGNAARCATYFFYSNVTAQSEMRFLTGAGEIRGQVQGPNLVRVAMTAITQLRKMKVLGEPGLYVNTGVPHFVIEKKPDVELSKKLRQVSDFGAAGANITFVQNLTESGLDAVTFERGVEGFTQACGTGAVAAAMYFQDLKGLKNCIEVHMPGGVLKIENAKQGIRPYLTGPVRIEFELEIK